ncbi:hypothetical protein PGQ11_013606 [Apiospora arundinis]|uniref:Uncharacterized protein n=1 Tax=Apiospora arundinis TaxID=335852 RepID=A0ABR2HR00_9PEZI
MLKRLGLLFISSILLCSFPLTHCQTNTTLVVQSHPVDWQAESEHRGTWGIITNCLTTIFACTWSIQHLNVPLSSDGSWSRRWRGAKWMTITILFPEFMVVHALFELLMATKALQKMNTRGNFHGGGYHFHKFPNFHNLHNFHNFLHHYNLLQLSQQG